MTQSGFITDLSERSSKCLLGERTRDVTQDHTDITQAVRGVRLWVGQPYITNAPGPTGFRNTGIK